MYLNVLVSALLPFLYQLYDPDHFPRPPTLPPKPQRMRKCRPRSVFNRKLFNGNMEAFIQVRACLCSLSLSASSAVSLAVRGRSLAFAPQSRADSPSRSWLWLSAVLQCRKDGARWGEKNGINLHNRNSCTVTEPPRHRILNSFCFVNVSWPMSSYVWVCR